MRASLVLLTALFLAACSEAKFSTSADALAAQSCTDTLHSVSLPIKTIFVVDTSGSNSASDPNMSVRGDSIQDYFSAFSARSNFSWGFMTFSGNSANSIISGSNAAAMQNAINTFYTINDAGLTPYREALAAARQNVVNDGGAANTKYIVVFISDGLPDPDVADSVLKSDVEAIINVRPGNVSFNAIYYGAQDPEASNRLSAMATAGKGQFLDTNNNPNGNQFTISDVINVPGLNCGQ